VYSRIFLVGQIQVDNFVVGANEVHRLICHTNIGDQWVVFERLRLECDDVYLTLAGVIRVDLSHDRGCQYDIPKRQLADNGYFGFKAHVVWVKPIVIDV